MKNEVSLREFCARRLRRLCRAAGLEEAEADASVNVFEQLVSPWANRARDAPSSWLSEISDDNTPIELSVAFGPNATDVRVLFEPQADAPSLEANRRAALDLHERLERDFGAHLEKFHRVVDLFAPPGMQGPFAIWSSVVFTKGGAPSFKTYFNPQARGVAAAPALVHEAMERLGLPGAWPTLTATSARRGPHLDELKYFALDLSPEANARVKVYVRHHEASPEDLEIACADQAGFVENEALKFSRSLGDAHRLTARATFTCSAFVGGSERPRSKTLYVPVCAYGRDDDVVRRRVSTYLASRFLDFSRYENILHGYADRPLDEGIGMQSWLAIQRPRHVPRITLYLATEAQQVFPPGTIPAATGRRAIVDERDAEEYLARYPLDQHPVAVLLATTDEAHRLGRDVAIDRLRVRRAELDPSSFTAAWIDRLLAPRGSAPGGEEPADHASSRREACNQHLALWQWLDDVLRDAALATEA